MINSSTPILIVEDHPVMLRAVLDILRNINPDLDLVECTKLDEAEKLLKQQSFHLLITDIQLQDDKKAGMELITSARLRYPDIKVIVYTQFDDSETLRFCILTDVNGYVTKNESVNYLTLAFNQILNGEEYFSPHIAKRLAKLEKEREQSDELLDPLKSLTAHEIDIIRLIGQDKTRKEVAAELILPLATVHYQVQKIAEKLGVKTDIGIALFAHKYRLI